MNESDLENELRALRPIAPSTSLEDRIAADLGESRMVVAAPRALRVPGAGVIPRPAAPGLFAQWLRGFGWALAGATAAVALLLHFQKAEQPEKPSTSVIAAVDDEADSFLPAESEREFVDADDSGILYGEGEEPLREIRYHSVERYAWINPETGARVEVEVPREDVVLMPVAMQ
jgi:hypothetical protein